MHYRNGREAKNGDVIVQIGGYGTDGGKVNAVGVLYDAKPGNDYCNGNIAPVQAHHSGLPLRLPPRRGLGRVAEGGGAGQATAGK
jgi:hypothetical protein